MEFVACNVFVCHSEYDLQKTIIQKKGLCACTRKTVKRPLDGYVLNSGREGCNSIPNN